MPDYRALSSLDEVQALVDKLLADDLPTFFDVETGYDVFGGVSRVAGSLRMYEPTQMIVGVSLTNSEKWARYLPLAHDHHPNLPSYRTWELLKPVFENKTMVAHNYLFDYQNLMALPLKGDGPEIKVKDFDDTLLMSYVLGKTEYHGLKFLTKHYFDYEQASLPSLFPDQASWTATEAKKLRFNPLPVSYEVTSYVCDDSRWLIRLRDYFLGEFEKPENQHLKPMYQIEKEILLILVDMQSRGVAFDWDTFDQDHLHGKRMQEFMTHEVKQRFLEDLGKESFDSVVNFNSTLQMRKLLFEDLGLTTTRVTKSGALSTDQVTLQGLASQSRGAAKLSEYKKFEKNLSFYDTWDAYKDSYDRRIHSTLTQTMVQSGRFASKDPNLQNLQKKFWFQVPEGDSETLMINGKHGRDYWQGSHRDYVVASSGYTLLSFDYSQGELRVLAGLANEPYLKKSFDAGLDVHKATAAQVFKVDYDGVTPNQRQRTKSINFGLLYGQGIKALGESLNISYDEAMVLMDQYFSAFSRVKSWIANQHALGENLGFVETFMGRRITLWDLTKTGDGMEASANRISQNAPVQGGLADIVKLAMIRSTRKLKERGWWNDQVRLLMNQHDSLVFEVSHDLSLESVYDVLYPAVTFNPTGTYHLHNMRGVRRPSLLAFPEFKTDWEYGQSWGHMKEFVR